MDIKEISSTKNELIKELVKLKSQQKNNEYFVEGINIVKEAFANNIVSKVFFTSSEIKNFKNYNVEKFLISNQVAEKLSDVKTNQGVFAVCKVKSSEIDFNNNILILDNIQDPGNMGTLLRSASAFNFKTVIASNSSVSFYNQKTIRSSQGNHINLNLINDDIEKMINILKKENYKIIGTFINEKESNDLQKTDKIALVLGNEGNGIDLKLKPLFDYNVIINTNQNVESLNVGVAGSIIMHDFFKNRS